MQRKMFLFFVYYRRPLTQKKKSRAQEQLNRGQFYLFLEK